MWTEIGAAIFGGLAVEVGRIGIQSVRGSKQELDEWHEQAISLASHGKGICDSARKRSELNYGKISDEADKIGLRLEKHVNPHPRWADDEIVHQILELSEIFSKLSAVTEASAEKPADESINEILEMSQRERRASRDIDMGETMEASKEYSPLVKEILKEMDIDVRSFGSKVEKELEGASSMEELIQTMADEFESSSSMIERRIEGNVIEDNWEDNLSLGVRIHLQLASNLSLEVINNISNVADQPTA